MRQRNMKLKGFTLIELLIVIAVIAILATILITNVAGARQKANDTKTLADLSAVQKAIAQCVATDGAPNIPLTATGYAGAMVCPGSTQVILPWPVLGLKGTAGPRWSYCAQPECYVGIYNFTTGGFNFNATAGIPGVDSYNAYINCNQNGCKPSDTLSI